jgi:1-deoxy-D-xylulose-5-phosphate reductoisomerase
VIRIAILGSTGSIGRSTLEVVTRHPERFEVVSLAAHRNVELLSEQVQRFRPKRAVLADETCRVADTGGATWRSGMQALIDLASDPEVDVVVNALVGAVGLAPTIACLEAGHRLALANKESLVAGGALVLDAAARGRGSIVPIDSEHSAILQCLAGQPTTAVQRLILTASGGPFRGRNHEEFWHVGPDEALKHPTWDMGVKITIDSATLANKALEVIEAHFLYGLEYNRIQAVVHPQSIVHSFVEFVDGSVLAQLGFPTMELPILYALSYPERIGDATLRTFDPVQASPLTFEEIDQGAFPLYGLGTAAGAAGGAAAAAFNAGNEIAVQAFIQGAIRFPEMADVVSAAIDGTGSGDLSNIHDVIAVDGTARVIATEAASRLGEARMRTNS